MKHRSVNPAALAPTLPRLAVDATCTSPGSTVSSGSGKVMFMISVSGGIHATKSTPGELSADSRSGTLYHVTLRAAVLVGMREKMRVPYPCVTAYASRFARDAEHTPGSSDASQSDTIVTRAVCPAVRSAAASFETPFKG